ncbi:MAG: CBS domain-containing protein [Verrucomicrobiae bacterium]|nr:CBS domain-containing protein [Verrucomicrobiae bacterium]
MNATLDVVAPSEPLDEFARYHVYRLYHKAFPVVSGGGEVVGCVRSAVLETVPPARWPFTPGGELASPCNTSNTVLPTADAWDAFSRMNENGTSRLLVVENHRLWGIVTLNDLLRFLAIEFRDRAAWPECQTTPPTEPDEPN